MMSAEPDSATRIWLCGPLRLEVDGRALTADLPTGQAGALLAYLLSSRDFSARREELIEAILPPRDAQRAQAALRPLLSRVRRALAPATIEGRERLRLALPEPVAVDVDEAARAVSAARAAAGDGRWAVVRERAGTARELLAAGLLPAQEGDWVEVRRREIEELELEALEWVARAGVALGGAELVAAEAASRELIARAPFRETGHRYLMESLAAAGNAAEALRAYDTLRVLLRDELGAAPAPEVQALHQRLLAGEARPAPEPPPARVASLPRALAPRESSAFIGRQEELQRLQAAWRDARAGAARFVTVGGEPGIGKTRLVSELARQAHESGHVLYATCQSETLVSYQPFVELLRSYLRAAGPEWARGVAGPGAVELARLVPEVSAGEASATDADPATRRYLLYEEITRLLGAASEHSPLLVVIDDLHWADPATLHLLGHVVRHSPEASLLIVGTYRSGEVGDEHPLAALLGDLRRDRAVERLSLRGLDEPEVAELIASHLGRGASPALVDAVHVHTDGNPFFVEEVILDLVERGQVVERERRCTVAPPAAGLGVPDGVREVLAGRFARLTESCRQVLTAAAVLGRSFSFDVLAVLTGAGDEVVMEALEEAGRAQLVVEVDDAAGADHAFIHALVRETLYATLTGPRRQRMHARAAAAIEQTVREPAAATLAVHYRLAGSAGDAEKAIGYSLQAGAHAQGLFAWDEAAGHWEGAVDVMARAGGHESERAQLLIGLAELMVAVGDVGRQISYLERALALYEQQGDARRAAQTHSRLGMAMSLVDTIYADHLDVGRAFEHFDAARPVLVGGTSRRAVGHLETGVSAALTYGLRIPEGLAAGARGMEAGEALGDELLWAGAAEAYAWHAIIGGRIREGLDVLARAFTVGDRHQRLFHAWMALNTMGQLTWGLGAPDEAQGHFEQASALPYFRDTTYRREISDALGRCHAARGELAEARPLVADANAAWISHALGPLLDLWDGRWDRVEALAGRVLETSRRNGNRWDQWASLQLAARVRALRGDLEGAAEALEPALAIVVDGGARYFELWVRPDLARVEAQRGRHDAARAHVERCREILEGREDWRARSAHVTLAEAIVLAYAERPGEADERFRDAQETFARYRLRLEEADTLYQWGRALAGADGAGAAADKLDLALEILRRHGAGAIWCDRVEASR
jgi:DNA-binding SARP family transcriptional activator/tetratricopeptide (TPR) repeat protein